MVYILTALLIVAISMLGYLIYKMNHDTSEHRMEKEEKERLDKERKHYVKVFNYNVTQAYGGK